MMLLIFGFLFMVFILAAVGILSQMPTFFIDMPSILLIVIPLIFFLLASKSGNIIGRYIVTSFKKGHVYTKAELESLSAAVKNTIKFILAVGGFGFLAGLIACLADVRALERIGPNLAVSLITLTYSITVSFFVFFPLQAWAENKINSAVELKNTANGA
jgi:flagellar motor component MotA